MKRPKILVILGPTASGKSALSVDLARKFNGEVISADSRQVYAGLDIGTGKIIKHEMRGVVHHMLDIVAPAKHFTVEQFKIKALKAITGIYARGKLPIICGGTGFYIQALVDNTEFPNVLPNKKLRARLEKLSAKKLLKKLTKLDLRRAKEIDPYNKRRIIRAIEIASSMGKMPRVLKNKPIFKALQIGILAPKTVLRKRIHDRLLARIKKGMIGEAKRLRADGLSLKRMEELGLEYRYLARYISGKISQEEMMRELENKIWGYARRQMSWFKRDKRIKWFGINKKNQIEKAVRVFLR